MKTETLSPYLMSNIQLQRYSCVFIFPNTSLFIPFLVEIGRSSNFSYEKEPFAKLKTRENFQKFHIREIKNTRKMIFGAFAKNLTNKVISPRG